MTTDLRIAVILNPALPAGFAANTAATIGIGLAALQPDLAGSRLTDRAGLAIHGSSRLPVPVLAAGQEALQALLARAAATCGEQAPEGRVVAFPSFARALHDHLEYEATFGTHSLAEEELDGIGLLGPAKWVRSLTGALKLLR
ncbi:DUF2000 family protein [Microvirga tunisiensis]|uniref:DUF2000 family protein n=1 Tax=Pannonibacter tanglangensis TaxID=2750084 RepID=A0A7X5JB18_9HYPH|nr:DUF2000 domain-containing protein [Pannonibacter sp. XCT-53]NBN80011.1 DUF2000 family protein [Pannonibacter sp. XCT-53]